MNESPVFEHVKKKQTNIKNNVKKADFESKNTKKKGYKKDIFRKQKNQHHKNPFPF